MASAQCNPAFCEWKEKASRAMPSLLATSASATFRTKTRSSALVSSEKNPAEAALPSPDQFLTVKQKARQLQVSAATIRRNALNLGGIRVGNRWRFTWDVPMPEQRPSRSLRADSLPGGLASHRMAKRERDELLGKYNEAVFMRAARAMRRNRS